MDQIKDLHNEVQKLKSIIQQIDSQLLENQMQLNEIEKVFFSLRENNINMDDVQQQIKSIKNEIQKTKQQVQNITSAQLNEISQYMRPPDVIRFFLEGLFVLLNGQILTWKKITQEMNNGSFIERMLKIDAKQIQQKNFEQFEKQYASDIRWDIKVLKNASQAIEPIALLISQLYEQKKQYDQLQILRKKINTVKKQQREKQKVYENYIKNREDLLKSKYEYQKKLESIQKGIQQNQNELIQYQKEKLINFLDKSIQCDLFNIDKLRYVENQNQILSTKIQKLQHSQEEQDAMYQQLALENQFLKQNNQKVENQNLEINKIRGSLNITTVENQNIKQQLKRQTAENLSLKSELENLRKYYQKKNDKLKLDLENQKNELNLHQKLLTFEKQKLFDQHTNTKQQFEQKIIQYQKEINYLMNHLQVKENQFEKQKKYIIQLEQDLKNTQRLYQDQQSLIKTMEAIIKNLRQKQVNNNDNIQTFKKKNIFETQNINKLCLDKATQTTNIFQNNIFYDLNQKSKYKQQEVPREKISFQVWKDMDSYLKNFNDRKSEISENNMNNQPVQFFYDNKDQITSFKSMQNKTQQRSKSQNQEKIREFV